MKLIIFIHLIIISLGVNLANNANSQPQNGNSETASTTSDPLMAQAEDFIGKGIEFSGIGNRTDYFKHWITQFYYEKLKAEKEKANAEKEKANAEKEKANAEKEKANAEKEKANVEKEKANVEKEKANVEKEKANVEKEVIRLNGTVNTLNTSLITASKHRNIFQSFIDFTETVEMFFEDCWPKWIGNRKKNSYTDEDWQKLFLNLENRKIRQLKLILAKREIDEKRFPNLVSCFMKQRCTQAHAMIPLVEKSETYKDLLGIISDDELQTVLQVFIFPDALMKSEKIANEQHVITDTEVGRNKQYRLLRIPSFKDFTDHAFMLDVAFKNFTDEVNDRNQSLNYAGPMATFKSNQNGAYVLFRNFPDAHFAWMKRDFLYLCPEHKTSMTIVALPNTGLNKALSVIKVSVGHLQLHDVHKKLVELSSPKQCLTDKNKTILFLVFGGGEDAIIAYQKYKMVEGVVVEAIETMPKAKELYSCPTIEAVVGSV